MLKSLRNRLLSGAALAPMHFAEYKVILRRMADYVAVYGANNVP